MTLAGSKAECLGHETTDGPIGGTTFCDGSCRSGSKQVSVAALHGHRRSAARRPKLSPWGRLARDLHAVVSRFEDGARRLGLNSDEAYRALCTDPGTDKAERIYFGLLGLALDDADKIAALFDGIREAAHG